MPAHASPAARGCRHSHRIVTADGRVLTVKPWKTGKGPPVGGPLRASEDGAGYLARDLEPGGAGLAESLAARSRGDLEHVVAGRHATQLTPRQRDAGAAGAHVAVDGRHH